MSNKSIRRKWRQGQPIFIVARFRSGSTLLWQLFDALERFYAFYEPYHDEASAYFHQPAQNTSLRHRIKRSNPYYNYDIVDFSKHSTEFAFKKLYMEKYDTYPELYAWTKHLINIAREQNRVPVLQFNRADFRIGWLKRKFGAYIIYLVRSPRDQYVSMLKASELETPPFVNRVPAFEWKTDPLIPYREPSYHLFYIRIWRLLLAKQFPFLINYNFSSSYQVAYAIWKLSVLLGVRQADLVLGFEEHFGSPEARGLKVMYEAGIFDSKEMKRLRPLVKPPRLNTYLDLAEEQWYEAQEREMDALFKRLGLTLLLGRLPLALIKAIFAPFWIKMGNPDFVGFFERYYSRQSYIYLDHLIHHFNVIKEQMQLSATSSGTKNTDS